MPLRVEVENYRCLARASWTLAPGVSLLVGPNGSGKTTLLDVPALLRDAMEKGVRRAVDDHGGPGSLVNLRVAGAESATLKASAAECSWDLELRPRGAQLESSNHIFVGDQQAELNPELFLTPQRDLLAPLTSFGISPVVVLRAPDGNPSPEMKAVIELRPDVVAPLATALGSYLVHGGYWLRALRMNGSQASSDSQLDRSGGNAFSVLRNWRDLRATRARWDFVVAGLKAAFPEAFEELEFESAGQTVAARIFAPRASSSIGAYFAPDGLLMGMLHLAAVASTPDDGAIAIDEFENALHPYAIRALLDHIRDWADAHRISVTLATHSPVLIDQVRHEPERLLVMDPASEIVPVPINQLRDPEWLAHFSLGDLYVAGEFGAQAAH